MLFLLLLCNISFSQTFCRPISGTINKTGVCVGSVTNPGNAFDDDVALATFTTINTDVGVFCTVEETMVLNQTASAGDQIAMYVGSGPGVLSLSLLSSVKVQARLNGVPVGSPVAVNNLLNLSVLGNPNVGLLKFTLPGDANQITFSVGGAVALLTEFRIYDVRLEFAKPTVSGGLSQTICSGTSTTLTATPVTGTSLAWYSSPTSTTALTTGNNYTTPNLTSNTTYYIGVTRVAGCESNERLPVVVNVSNPIAPVISTTGTAICSTGTTQATTLSVINPVLGTTYSWFNVANGGAALVTGATYLPTVPTGISTFYVEASIGTCKSTRTQVTVTSTPVPAVASILTKSVSILAGQNATLSAFTAEPNVTLDWYDSLTGGTKLISNSTTFTTPVLAVTKIYYVESVSLTGGCVSATRVPVTVTVLPAASGGCLEANSQQTAQNGICLLCSSTSPNNSVDGNSSTAARLTLAVGLLNGWIQQTLQFNNPGKAGDIVDVDLEVPVGIADLSLLGGISLATYNGATYNGDRTFINNPLINLRVLSGNKFRASILAGANFDRVEIRLGSVVAALTSLDIYQATYRYKAPLISGNQAICVGQTTTLNANLALGETIKWYDALTGGNLLVSTAAYTTPILTANTTYYVELTRNGCVNSERNPVVVTVTNPVAPATVVASPVNICTGDGTTITVQSPVVDTTYKWYDVATGGTALFTGTSYSTPSLTASKDYYVEGVIGSCSSTTRTKVTVNVNSRPSIPIVASSTVTVLPGQTTVLAVSSPEANVTFNWYDAPTGGNLLVNGLGTSTYSRGASETLKTYYIEARNTLSDCVSSSRAVINVIVNSSASTCLLGASQVTTANGSPIICVLPICATVTDPDFSVDGNSGTAARLTLPVALGGSIQQMITFGTPGKAGDIIEVELGVPIGLADISLLSSINLQSYNSGSPNADLLSVNSLVNVQILGSNRFKVSLVAAGPFTSVQVKLNVAALALFTSLDIYEASYRYPVTITGNSTPICAGQTTVLTATPNGGQTANWFTAPTGGTSLTSSFTTPALNVTTPFYLEETRDGCTSRREVLVTVLPIPQESDIIITSPLTADCAGKVVLAPTSALAGATFKYYIDQNKTQEITSSTVDGVTYLKDTTTGTLTISGLSTSAVPYKYYVSILNGTCENAGGTLKEVVVNHPAGSPLTVTATLAGCAKVNLKDAITNFDTTGSTTYTFFDALNNPITDAAAANIVTTGTYFIQAQKIGLDCPSVKLSVVATVTTVPTLTGVTSSIVVTKGSLVTLSGTSSGTISWYDPQGNVLGSNSTGPLNTVGVFT